MRGDLSGGPVSAQGAVLDGRYLIDLDQTLPEFDSVGASAHGARDLEDHERSVFALIADPAVPRRDAVWRASSAGGAPGTPRVLAAAWVDYPDGRGRWWTIILARPMGGSLAAAVGTLGEQDIRLGLAPALVDRLDTLHQRGLAHRRLRPDTVFWQGADGAADLVLSECFSEPPGASQPAAFEPLGRAQAHPHGRGHGGPEADCYALGVTLLALSRNGMPWATRTAADLTDERLARGSFATLTEGGGVPPGMVTLIRGLLADAEEDRWTLTDVRAWLTGARVQPRTLRPPREPLVPLRLGGRAITSRRQIAHAMAEAPEQAVKAMRAPAFVEWLTHGLNDPTTGARIEKIIAQSPPTRRGVEGAMVARTIQALDPGGPVRFGRLALMPDGLPAMLACAMADADRTLLAALDEVLGDGLIEEALDAWPDSLDAAEARREAGLAAEHLRRREIGHGLERVLYVLNRDLTCRSPRLSDRPVASAADLLRALERLVADGERASPLVDRHMAAFLATRGAPPRVIAGLAQAAEVPPHLALATLRLLAPIQTERKVGPLPRLCDGLADALKPLLGSLRGRARRERLQTRLARLTGSGDLGALAEGFDFLTEREQDERGYREAVDRWLESEAELTRLADAIGPDDAPAREAGLLGAATTAYAVLSLVALVSLVASAT